MASLNHPIVEQSFAVIDQEVGAHTFSTEEYAIVRRVIHSTADFEFKQLLRFSPGAIAGAIAALRQQTPIVTDVSMVKQGILTLVSKTFNNPIIAAVDQAAIALPGKTRTETGMLRCQAEYPHAIYVIGNAPTALLALCHTLPSASQQMSEPSSADPGMDSPVSDPRRSERPALVIGAPVGFISVIESKAVLAQTDVPKIWVEGRKGGSAVAAAILNALIVLAWES